MFEIIADTYFGKAYAVLRSVFTLSERLFLHGCAFSGFPFPVKVSSVTLGKNQSSSLTVGLHCFPYCICLFFIGNKIIDAGLGHSAYMQKKAGT